MSKLLLALLLLSGCLYDGIKTPRERGIDVNHSIVKVYNQDKAMLLFEAMVEDAFSVKLDNIWETTTTWWTDTKCPHSDNLAVIYKGECTAGRMFSCHEMYVAVNPHDRNRTCGTALIHEFGHCLSWHVFGTYDGPHEGPIWEVVTEARLASCERDW